VSIDSPLDQEERYLAYGSGIYLVVAIWILYLQYVVLNNQNIDLTSVTKFLPTDAFAIASLTALSFAVGYFLKYAGIHRFLDTIIFGLWAKINRKITKALRDRFNEKFADPLKYNQPTPGQLMYIFYEFVNKQQDSWLIQRSLAFSYSLKYKLSMNLIFFSAISAFAAFFISGTDGTITEYDGIVVLFFIIVAVVCVIVSQTRIRKDIETWVTQPQLDRILYDNREELDKLFSNRFSK
jgi:hypothetical protein